MEAPYLSGVKQADKRTWPLSASQHNGVLGDAQGIPQEHIPHFTLQVFAVMCQSSVVLKHFTSPAVGLSLPHQGIFTNLLN